MYIGTDPIPRESLMRTNLRSDRSVLDQLAPGPAPGGGGLELTDGSRVAVIGGGPAGSFFSYFLLRMAEVQGIEVEVDVHEPRRFEHCGPGGCNHCGGIVSESLVQLLAAEGINLPPSIVQRGIDSYVMHMDVGTVRIETPLHEKRIAAVFRGNGPRGSRHAEIDTFDGFLLEKARGQGARVVRKLVSGIEWNDGRPVLRHPDGPGSSYDLVAVATGINSNLVGGLRTRRDRFRSPESVPTYICEFRLDADVVSRCLGTSMHVFLLDIPRLEFAALIPKGDVITLVLLGREIDDDLVRSFLEAPEVRACFPDGVSPPRAACTCSPRINVRPGNPAFGDRFVAIGDTGTTRLYKDGIGAAFHTAKTAAATAVLDGISERAFRRGYGRVCRELDRDNSIGRFMFTFNHQIQRRRFSRRAILRMVTQEQARDESARPMSRVLWDMFTGSAPYREVFRNTLRPSFMTGLARNLAWSMSGEAKRR